MGDLYATDRIPEGWLSIGRFSELATTDETGINLLNQFIDFRHKEEVYQIPKSGYILKQLGSDMLHRIVGLDYVPDKPIIGGSYSDGLVIVKLIN